MCKCAWLKKLLGLKKDCCCRSKEPVAPIAPVSPETPVDAGQTEETPVSNQ